MISVGGFKFLSVGKRRRSLQLLTEVTVMFCFVDLTHGDVPASSSADSCVARLLALQSVPGHP